MDDQTRTDQKPGVGAEGGDSEEQNIPPAVPNPEGDSALGDSDQHSKVPTPPAEKVSDAP